MIFVDTWAWIALLDATDQYHRIAQKTHRKLLKKCRRFVTSDFVLNELINYVYSVGPAVKAQATINTLLSSADAGIYLLRPRFSVPVSPCVGPAPAL